MDGREDPTAAAVTAKTPARMRAVRRGDWVKRSQVTATVNGTIHTICAVGARAIASMTDQHDLTHAHPPNAPNRMAPGSQASRWVAVDVTRDSHRVPGV